MAPLYTYQPFKGIYVTYFALSLVLIKLPAWCIYYIPRKNRQRPSWDWKRCIIVSTAQSFSAFPVKVNLRQKVDPQKKYNDAQFAWVEPVNDDLIRGRLRYYANLTGVAPARISGYWLLKAGHQREGKAQEDERTVLHFHGGAFTTGTANPNFITQNITRGLLQYSHSLLRTFGVEYRLSSGSPNPPENPFPAAALDALASYQYLVEDIGFKPENIILAGDSAGGHIAEVLIRYLIDNPIPSLPPPGYLLSMSTTLDLSCARTGPGSSQQRNAPYDIFARKKPWDLIIKYNLKAFLGPIDAELTRTDPYLSPTSPFVQPAEGLFTGFPPAYVVAGGSERMCDDSEILARRLAEAGVKVVTDVPPDAVHDFLGFTWHEPERTQTLIRISHWIDAHY